MGIGNVRWDRPLSSYSKVQRFVTLIRRNRRWQLRSGVRAASYLDIGCGPNTHDNFVNLDYQWLPGVDICWDLRLGIPFDDNRFIGVFAEHCFEHFCTGDLKSILLECKRVLCAQGILRVVVPDAELYLRRYIDAIDRKSGRDPFPFESSEAAQPLWTPLSSVNRVFYQDRDSPAGHRTMFDYDSLRKLLEVTGFVDVTKRKFKEGSDPSLLIDQPSRLCESLYVEAQKN